MDVNNNDRLVTSPEETMSEAYDKVTLEGFTLYGEVVQSRPIILKKAPKVRDSRRIETSEKCRPTITSMSRNCSVTSTVSTSGVRMSSGIQIKDVSRYKWDIKTINYSLPRAKPKKKSSLLKNSRSSPGFRPLVPSTKKKVGGKSFPPAAVRFHNDHVRPVLAEAKFVASSREPIIEVEIDASTLPVFSSPTIIRYGSYAPTQDISSSNSVNRDLADFVSESLQDVKEYLKKDTLQLVNDFNAILELPEEVTSCDYIHNVLPSEVDLFGDLL